MSASITSHQICKMNFHIKFRILEFVEGDEWKIKRHPAIEILYKDWFFLLDLFTFKRLYWLPDEEEF